MNLSRRRFVGCAGGAAATTALATDWLWPKYSVSYRRRRSCVAVLEAHEYSDKIEGLLFEGLQLFDLNVSDRSVLLKPNLVEDLPGPVNTQSALVGAAARCFLRLGARRVVIGEGPGHERDTELVLEAAGLRPHLNDPQIEFVDLNRDELMKVDCKASYSGLGALWLPRTALASNLIVSMPKIKTHHWAGVTLSMKNMFGIVPGMKYGWPKNILHWHGIHESILDICATAPMGFVIADGIRAMEGDGPLLGIERRLNRIVLSDDPVAADATCARLMGFAPERIRHIAEGARFLGNLASERILMLAEPLTVPTRPFSVLPGFEHLIQTTATAQR